MAPHDLRRPFKRPAISDQQRRREASLRRQDENREEVKRRARSLVSTVLSFQAEPKSPSNDQELELQCEEILVETESSSPRDTFDVRHASKLRGPEARQWFSKQLMLPEWMIDVPDNLNTDWLVFNNLYCSSDGLATNLVHKNCTFIINRSLHNRKTISIV